MFPSLAFRRIGAPDKIGIAKRKIFSQYYGLSGQIGSGVSACRPVLDQPQCDPDPFCLQAHPRWYSQISTASRTLLDGRNQPLRPVLLNHPLRACSAVSPSSSFMYISQRTFAAPVQVILVPFLRIIFNHCLSLVILSNVLQAKPKDKPSSDSHAGPRINESITAPFIRLVTDDGTQ